MTRARDHADGLLAQIDRVGSCARPVRIAAIREDGQSRVILVTCKDRRAVLCPACSHTYKGDAWHVVASGLRGGKGVATDVSTHPRVFVTLTAPSFGPVHSRHGDGGGNAVCHRGRQARCRHGRLADCRVHHASDDPLLGQPICPECFDYPGAILWNAHVSALWQRTAMRLVRCMVRSGDVGTDGFRLSYVKAVEFQRRGLVHLHVVVRADGEDGPGAEPPASVTPTLLIETLAEVVARVTTTVPLPGRAESAAVGWGSQMAATELVTGGPDDERQLAVAAYTSKYATKTADSTGALAHRIRRASEIPKLQVNDHQRRLVETAWSLGGRPDLSELRLRRCAHAFGYRGHVVTKSRRYSTTFSALRSARAEYGARTGEDREDRTGVHYGYAGRGYDDPEAGILAFHLAQLATTPTDRGQDRGVPDEA